MPKDRAHGSRERRHEAVTHIAHQFKLVTDHDEANDSDLENGSGDKTKKLNQKTILHFAIGGRTLLCSFDGIGPQLFGGCKGLLDVKTKTGDAKHPSAYVVVSAAFDKRATEANRIYLARAHELDAEHQGPLELELRSHGKDGRAITQWSEP